MKNFIAFLVKLIIGLVIFTIVFIISITGFSIIYSSMSKPRIKGDEIKLDNVKITLNDDIENWSLDEENSSYSLGKFIGPKVKGSTEFITNNSLSIQYIRIVSSSDIDYWLDKEIEFVKGDTGANKVLKAERVEYGKAKGVNIVMELHTIEGNRTAYTQRIIILINPMGKMYEILINAEDTEYANKIIKDIKMK